MEVKGVPVLKMDAVVGANVPVVAVAGDPESDILLTDVDAPAFNPRCGW